MRGRQQVVFPASFCLSADVIDVCCHCEQVLFDVCCYFPLLPCSIRLSMALCYYFFLVVRSKYISAVFSSFLFFTLLLSLFFYSSFDAFFFYPLCCRLLPVERGERESSEKAKLGCGVLGIAGEEWVQREGVNVRVCEGVCDDHSC